MVWVLEVRLGDVASFCFVYFTRFSKPFHFRTRQSSSLGLDYCYDESKIDETPSITDTCKFDDDCLLEPCVHEPCLKPVCRNSRCIFAEQCGNTACDSDEFCCNPSCGLCSPMGSSCRQEVCESCGLVTCDVGEVCCNPDCGICAPSLGDCPQICNTATEVPSNEILYCATAADCVTPPCLTEPCLSSICLDAQCALAYECGNTFCPFDEICCDPRSSLCSAGQRCNEYWIVQLPGDNGDTDESLPDKVSSVAER